MFAVFSTCFKSPFCFGLFWWMFDIYIHLYLVHMVLCFLLLSKYLMLVIFWTFLNPYFEDSSGFYTLNLFQNVCCYIEVNMVAILLFTISWTFPEYLGYYCWLDILLITNLVANIFSFLQIWSGIIIIDIDSLIFQVLYLDKENSFDGRHFVFW